MARPRSIKTRTVRLPKASADTIKHLAWKHGVTRATAAAQLVAMGAAESATTLAPGESALVATPQGVELRKMFASLDAAIAALGDTSK